jgi:hypothetical protein
MKKEARLFWRIVTIQACVILAWLLWRFYIGTKAYLAHPDDGDLYAHNWSFQVLVFCIFRLFPALVGMVALFAFEWFILRNRRKTSN